MGLIRTFFCLACMLIAGCATIPDQNGCVMTGADRAWLGQSLETWRTAESEWLGLESGQLPSVTTFDRQCTYAFPNGDLGAVVNERHDGTTVTLAGHALPIGPVSFADGSGQFFMSLPSVWAASGQASELGLDRLMTGVLLHEIMHTRQAELANSALTSIEARSSEEIGDDRIQATFSNDPEYVAAYERERDFLYAAATASDGDEAILLAREALATMDQRRARWFVGEHSHYSDMEDVFLTMEGMGQWLMYRYFRSQPDVTPETATRVARRGGWWTQDEGLALFLVLDRLLPDWRQRAFQETDWGARTMLQAATSSARLSGQQSDQEFFKAGGRAMQHATGTFQITMTPEAQADPDQFGAGSARFGLSKRFSGGLEGEASGTMLSVGAPASGASAAYVAIDRFSGSLDGRNGGFVLIHRGTMNKAGEAELEVIIAPDSGTGELEGISGTLQINSSDGGHSYDLAYSMPGKV